MEALQAASQSTPGMTVDEREIKGAWNPMNENWLPKDMTSIEVNNFFKVTIVKANLTEALAT